MDLQVRRSTMGGKRRLHTHTYTHTRPPPPPPCSSARSAWSSRASGRPWRRRGRRRRARTQQQPLCGGSSPHCARSWRPSETPLRRRRSGAAARRAICGASRRRWRRAEKRWLRRWGLLAAPSLSRSDTLRRVCLPADPPPRGAGQGALRRHCGPGAHPRGGGPAALPPSRRHCRGCVVFVPTGGVLRRRNTPAFACYPPQATRVRPLRPRPSTITGRLRRPRRGGPPSRASPSPPPWSSGEQGGGGSARPHPLHPLLHMCPLAGP